MHGTSHMLFRDRILVYFIRGHSPTQKLPIPSTWHNKRYYIIDQNTPRTSSSYTLNEPWTQEVTQMPMECVLVREQCIYHLQERVHTLQAIHTPHQRKRPPRHLPPHLPPSNAMRRQLGHPISSDAGRFSSTRIAKNGLS